MLLDIEGLAKQAEFLVAIHLPRIPLPTRLIIRR